VFFFFFFFFNFPFFFFFGCFRIVAIYSVNQKIISILCFFLSVFFFFL